LTVCTRLDPSHIDMPVGLPGGSGKIHMTTTHMTKEMTKTKYPYYSKWCNEDAM
jgi:hypothetical protein